MLCYEMICTCLVRLYLEAIVIISFGSLACFGIPENGVRHESWSAVHGGSVHNLLSDVRFPHRPTSVDYLKSFSFVADTDVAHRIRGYFVAPEDGEYRFFTSCQSGCELFLDRSQHKGENHPIISQETAAKNDVINKRHELQSTSVKLTKGKYYYIEALATPRSTDGELSFGVRLPNGEEKDPIPAEMLRISKRAQYHKARTLPVASADEKPVTDVPRVLVPHSVRLSASEPVRRDEEIIASFIKQPLDSGRSSEGKAVLDMDGSKYLDKDSVEPGINIFPDKKVYQFTGSHRHRERNSDEDSNDADLKHDNREYKDSVDYSKSLTESAETNSAFDAASFEASGVRDNNSRTIVANFGDGNQSFTKALNNAIRNSSFTHLRVEMPGGKAYRILTTAKDKPRFEQGSLHQSGSADSPELSLDRQATRASQRTSLSSSVPATAVRHGKELTESYYGGGFGGYAGGYGGNEIGHPGDYHPGLMHPSMPEGHGYYTPDFHTQPANAVAMVPAILHHDHPDYGEHDHGQGYHHVEPLMPVFLGHHHGHHDMMGHYDHHDMHLPIYDTHHEHDYHPMHHLEPVLVHEPAPVIHHKPDIIKVEFVPEEAEIKLDNKSAISSRSDKKAGTVRVQFIAGDAGTDGSKASPELSAPDIATHRPVEIASEVARKDSEMTAVPGDQEQANFDGAMRRKIVKTKNASARQRIRSQSNGRHAISLKESKSDDDDFSLTIGEEEYVDGDQDDTKSSSIANKGKEQAVPKSMNVKTPQGNAQVTVENLRSTPTGGQEETVSGKVVSEGGKVMPFRVTVVTDKDPIAGATEKEAASIGSKSKKENAHVVGDYDALKDSRSAKAFNEVGKSPPVEMSLQAYQTNLNSAGLSGVAGYTGTSANNNMMRSVGGSGAVGGGGGSGVSGNQQEQIEPEIPPGLENQFPGLHSDTVASASPASANPSSRSPPPGDDRIFFSGSPLQGANGGIKPGDEHVFVGGEGANPPISAPAGAPVGEVPSGQPGYHGPFINPVANEIMEDMNTQRLTPEEALQMMNDFVSGNQDTSKSIKNMQGMLSQVTQARSNTLVTSQTPVPQDEPPSRVFSPNVQSMETTGLLNSAHAASPEYGLADPSMQSTYNPPPQTQLFNHPTNYEQGSVGNLEYTGDQRGDMHQPGDGLPRMSDSEFGRANEMSPHGPPPPVHVYGEYGQRGAGEARAMAGDFGSSGPDADRSFQSGPPEQHENMVAESAAPNDFSYDGYADPSFHKSLSERMGDSSHAQLGNIIDKLDPHEMMSAASFHGSPESGAMRHEDGHLDYQNEVPLQSRPSDEALMSSSELASQQDMPSIEVPSSAASITPEHSQLNYNNFGDVTAVPNVETPPGISTFSFGSEQQYDREPVGHFSADVASDPSAVDSFASRKFHTPHADEARQSSKDALKNLERSEAGSKKRESPISALYTDSIFPEDFADIESLKGSLLGKTLTNFDRLEGMAYKAEAQTTGSKRTAMRLDAADSEKATFPVEGTVLRSSGKGRTFKHYRKSRVSHPLSVHAGSNKRKSSVYQGHQRRRSKRQYLAKLAKDRRSVETTEVLPDAVRTDTAPIRSANLVVPVRSRPYAREATASVGGSQVPSGNFPSSTYRSLSSGYPSQEHRMSNNRNSNHGQPIVQDRASRQSQVFTANSGHSSVATYKAFNPSSPLRVAEHSNFKAMAHTSMVTSQLLRPEALKVERPLERNLLTARVASGADKSFTGQFTHGAPSRWTAAAPSLHPEADSADKAALRGLVSELKDVLHKLKQVKINGQLSLPGDEGSHVTYADSLPSGYDVQISNGRFYPEESEVLANERNEILAAGSSRNAPSQYQDIETFSQDVWEPGTHQLGLDSTGLNFNRAMIPSAEQRGILPKNVRSTLRRPALS